MFKLPCVLYLAGGFESFVTKSLRLVTKIFGQSVEYSKVKNPPLRVQYITRGFGPG